jgi:hypothetical protein
MSSSRLPTTITNITKQEEARSPGMGGYGPERAMRRRCARPEMSAGG